MMPSNCSQALLSLNKGEIQQPLLGATKEGFHAACSWQLAAWQRRDLDNWQCLGSTCLVDYGVSMEPVPLHTVPDRFTVDSTVYDTHRPLFPELLCIVVMTQMSQDDS